MEKGSEGISDRMGTNKEVSAYCMEGNKKIPQFCRYKNEKTEWEGKGRFKMKLFIQRVNHAEVKVDGEIVGQIGKGLLVFVGVGKQDTLAVADKYLKKLLGLRIFEDEAGKTNLALADVNGELSLFHSLRYMQTVKRETGRASLRQVIRRMQMLFMNI